MMIDIPLRPTPQDILVIITEIEAAKRAINAFMGSSENQEAEIPKSELSAVMQLINDTFKEYEGQVKGEVIKSEILSDTGAVKKYLVALDTEIVHPKHLFRTGPFPPKSETERQLLNLSIPGLKIFMQLLDEKIKNLRMSQLFGVRKGELLDIYSSARLELEKKQRTAEAEKWKKQISSQIQIIRQKILLYRVYFLSHKLNELTDLNFLTGTFNAQLYVICSKYHREKGITPDSVLNPILGQLYIAMALCGMKIKAGGRKNAGINTGQKGTRKEPLTDNQNVVLELLKKQPKTKGLTGKAILQELERMDIIIDQSTLTKSIIPALKKSHGVKNKPGAGYYIT